MPLAQCPVEVHHDMDYLFSFFYLLLAQDYLCYCCSSACCAETLVKCVSFSCFKPKHVISSMVKYVNLWSLWNMCFPWIIIKTLVSIFSVTCCVESVMLYGCCCSCGSTVYNTGYRITFRAFCSFIPLPDGHSLHQWLSTWSLFFFSFWM